MQLSLVHWTDVEAYLERHRGIIIPIGSTEQHGPNGLMGTDAVCAEHIASEAGEKLDLLVAPTISVGMAVHHLAFPGSISLQPTTLIRVIIDIVNSLHKNGFEQFFFVNGHGGNISTVYTAFSQIHAETVVGMSGTVNKAIRCGLFNWWDGNRSKALYEALYGDAEGHHATPSEIALANFAASRPIREVEMMPKIAGTGGVSGPESLSDDPVGYRRLFPDGRVGSDPSLASLEDGEKFSACAVADAADAMNEFFVHNQTNL